MTSGRLLSRIKTFAQRAVETLKAPRSQRVAWAIAVVVFFGGFAVSVAARPALILAFHPGLLLVVIFVLGPVMTALNMAVTRETAHLVGVELSFYAALKLAVMSTVANHLPVPGGLILRTAAFQSAGARLKDAGLANVTSGISWMSATFVFVGACALSLNALLAAALSGLGVILFAAMVGIARPLPGGRAVLTRLMLMNLASAATYALSIFVALEAFGTGWNFPQAAVIASAGVIGAASSIAPSGLGIREAAAAALAALIGAGPAGAFAATATVHMAMALLTGTLSLYFFLRGRAAPENSEARMTQFTHG